MGVNSAPPPMPVSPTRTPIRRPCEGELPGQRCPCQRRCRASGSRAPSQRPHSTAARLVCLAKGEGGLWRRVIAGQKPACIAGRDTGLNLYHDRKDHRPAVGSVVDELSELIMQMLL